MRLKEETVREAFGLMDLLAGMNSGGIEAPRILLATERKSDTEITVRWNHPKTCGYSDVCYHYADTSEHEDTFLLEDGALVINGSRDALICDDSPEFLAPVEAFCKKWGLVFPGKGYQA